jgi:putative transposase
VSCYRLIDAEKAHHTVSRLGRVLGVARAGSYAFTSRPPSPRALADQALVGQIGEIHATSPATTWKMLTRIIITAANKVGPIAELGVACSSQPPEYRDARSAI